MLIQLNINLSEDDYFAFNKFCIIESADGKRAIRKDRIFFILGMAVLAAVIIFMLGLTTYAMTYVAGLLLWTLICMLLTKKMLVWNLKARLKRAKKRGKLPFDPVSTLEFYEDKMVDIAASSRTERSYAVLERICILKERYIILYDTSISGNIIPIPQVKRQVNYEDFVEFLSQKCANIEYY